IGPIYRPIRYGGGGESVPPDKVAPAPPALRAVGRPPNKGHPQWIFVFGRAQKAVSWRPGSPVHKTPKGPHKRWIAQSATTTAHAKRTHSAMRFRLRVARSSPVSICGITDNAEMANVRTRCVGLLMEGSNASSTPP